MSGSENGVVGAGRKLGQRAGAASGDLQDVTYRIRWSGSRTTGGRGAVSGGYGSIGTISPLDASLTCSCSSLKCSIPTTCTFHANRFTVFSHLFE